MILAGDIGGTKCNLALVEKSGTGYAIALVRRYESAKYAKFEDVIADFLRDAHAEIEKSAAGKIAAAGFGVAGPVVGRAVHVTNLPWAVEAAALETQLNCRRVALLNDLEATGYSLPWLAEVDVSTLNEGTPSPHGARALIAAGTGLGESILHWCGDRYVVAPGEGGHTDFAPRTEKEIELLRYMHKENKCVSWEQVVSGRGFYLLHQFLAPAVRHASFGQQGADPAQEITELALTGACAVCVEALEMWTELYGAESGNLALKALARNGVFVAGGIAPKILPKMKDGAFLRAFCEKEKFSDLLAKIPVQIVLNQYAPLLGAAAEADRAG